MQEPTKRQIQAMNTKKKIYDISIELMKNRGYDNVTIQEICKKAGVSVGTFYHYFESKNEIFTELYKIADDFFHDTIKERVSSENTIDKIMEYFYYYAEYNEKMGIDMMKQLYNSNNKMFITKGRYMQTVLDTIIEDGQEKKEVSNDMKPEDMTKFLFVLMRGVVYDWCLNDGKYDLKEAIGDTLKKILKTMKP